MKFLTVLDINGMRFEYDVDFNGQNPGLYLDSTSHPDLEDRVGQPYKVVWVDCLRLGIDLPYEPPRT
jgi:hypothetical protein